ncbi:MULTISPECIES: hypothetical protein [unclassified Corallococcus]|uniref:hypothetical protein n=1 Tax=unclassified Corallococcus TaxID=2685029 RepID=UPI001F1EC6F5|nr:MULTISPECIES: hypothetical protein [unclassified Corallococcus]
MRTKSSWKRVVTASMLMLAVGCRGPAAGLRAAGASDSGNSSESGASSQGDSSQSDSGNSSQGDSSQGESSKSDSGNSSQGESSKSGSNGSSDEGSSESGSGESSDSDSGNSSHGDSSKSDSGDSSGSSDHSTGEGDSSHSGSSENSNAGTSESNQVDQGDDSRTRSESSNGRENQLLSTATVALTVMGLGIVIWQSYERSARRKGKRPSPKEVGHAAQVYLRARTHQLREDLALGAGPTVEDLAQAARIRRENLDVFGKLLRTHRKELLMMADAKTLTPERARAWLERVGQLARTEPRLEEDRQAFLQEQEGAPQAAEALQ